MNEKPLTRGDELKQLMAMLDDVVEKTNEDNEIVVAIEIYNSALNMIEKADGFLDMVKKAAAAAEAKVIEKMTAAGMTKTYINGIVYAVQEVNAYSVDKENRELQLRWLEEIGAAGIIKEKWELTEDKTEFLKWLKEHDKAGAISPIDRNVHHRTFNSFIQNDWPEIAETLPEEKRKLPEFVNHFEGSKISKTKERNGKI